MQPDFSSVLPMLWCLGTAFSGFPAESVFLKMWFLWPAAIVHRIIESLGLVETFENIWSNHHPSCLTTQFYMLHFPYLVHNFWSLTAENHQKLRFIVQSVQTCRAFQWQLSFCTGQHYNLQLDTCMGPDSGYITSRANVNPVMLTLSGWTSSFTSMS